MHNIQLDNIQSREKSDGIERPSILIPRQFPLDFFPVKYRQAIEEISEAIGTPVEIPAAALLSLIGACIGRTRGVQIKEGWIEHPNLYLAVIGNSGIWKSPSCHAIFKHVEKIEKEWYNDAINSSNDRDCVMNQLIVDDATTEALGDVLDANPRGILWNRDELAGLFRDLDKYAGKEGSTMTRLNSAYDSGSWKINRVEKGKNKYILYATLSIFGTIQPRSLIEVFSMRDIEVGFIPRFLFINVNQDKPALWTEIKISQKTEENLSELVETVVEYNFDVNLKPVIVVLKREARDAFIAWYDQLLLESWQEIDDYFQMSIVKKLQAQCLRLALIAHCMEAVSKGKSEMKLISKRTMEKAIHLANYFMGQKKKTLRLIISGKVFALSTVVKMVAQAIVALESEITNGMLSTARITELVNQGLDERFQFDSRAVGRAAASLSLRAKHMPDGQSRGIQVQKEDIERLRKFLDTMSETSEMSDY